MLLSAFCFASMGALSHGVGRYSSWLGVVFARAFTNFVFVAALAVVTSRPLIVFAAPKNLWIRSITGTCSMLGTFYAFTHLPVAEAISIVNTTPIWMVLLVYLMTRQNLSYSTWAGVACGTVGVLLVQQPQFDQAGIGILAGLGGAFFGAIAVYNIHLLKMLHPTTIVAHFSLIASVVSFFAMVATFGTSPWQLGWTGRVLLELCGVGVLGTVGQLAMTRGYMAGEPAVKAVVALAQVAFGVLFDMVFWNRSFDHLSIMGIVLITSPTVFFVLEEKYESYKKSVPRTAK